MSRDGPDYSDSLWFDDASSGTQRTGEPCASWPKSCSASLGGPRILPRRIQRIVGRCTCRANLGFRARGTHPRDHTSCAALNRVTDSLAIRS